MDRPLDSEQRLMQRARSGDAGAFALLVAPHEQIAYRTACLFSRSPAEAEDAAQEALVKAWRALPRFRDGEPFRPWLLAIVANEARSQTRSALRRGAREVRAGALAARFAAAHAPPPETALLTAERERDLARALAALPERDRLVLGLRYVLDLSERETAAALGVRPGTVKSRLSRALGRLREQVQER